ncbi:MAG: chorismate mutase [Peptoniphilaceae bacterium]|nr:chorismate mutase [Peptoniphilaceae bacterium]MDD7383203.1 chorismate mutase [Peptoniphilaceae bacterium]MDY3738427.1 chorismate mutase [Peptoniphilaceae bacterium]
MIEEYRKEIDKLDNLIVKLFLERNEISKKISKEKKKYNKNILDSSRENEIIDRFSKLYDEDIEYIKKLYKTIFEISKSIQENENEK